MCNTLFKTVDLLQSKVDSLYDLVVAAIAVIDARDNERAERFEQKLKNIMRG